MFNSILTSILRVTKNIPIAGGKISLGFTARTTKQIKSPPQRRVIR